LISDITYIKRVHEFCHLASITDMYSPKIMSNNLEIKDCVRAHNITINQTKNIKQLIHHSERGIQCCNNKYTQILKRKKIYNSMTEKNRCYEQWN